VTFLPPPYPFNTLTDANLSKIISKIKEKNTDFQQKMSIFIIKMTVFPLFAQILLIIAAILIIPLNIYISSKYSDFRKHFRG